MVSKTISPKAIREFESRPHRPKMKVAQIIIGGAVIFKENRGKRTWLVVKLNKDGGWEIPKVSARRGESSVRAVLRLTGEMAGMSAKVLEEVGRFSGEIITNSKSIPQRYYYYLMLHKAGEEFYGFEDYQWLEYAKAANVLELKREKDILKNAKNLLAKWEKERQKKS